MNNLKNSEHNIKTYVETYFGEKQFSIELFDSEIGRGLKSLLSCYAFLFARFNTNGGFNIEEIREEICLNSVCTENSLIIIGIVIKCFSKLGEIDNTKALNLICSLLCSLKDNDKGFLVFFGEFFNQWVASDKFLAMDIIPFIASGFMNREFCMFLQYFKWPHTYSENNVEFIFQSLIGIYASIEENDLSVLLLPLIASFCIIYYSKYSNVLIKSLPFLFKSPDLCPFFNKGKVIISACVTLNQKDIFINNLKGFEFLSEFASKDQYISLYLQVFKNIIIHQEDVVCLEKDIFIMGFKKILFYMSNQVVCSCINECHDILAFFIQNYFEDSYKHLLSCFQSKESSLKFLTLITTVLHENKLSLRDIIGKRLSIIPKLLKRLSGVIINGENITDHYLIFKEFLEVLELYNESLRMHVIEFDEKKRFPFFGVECICFILLSQESQDFYCIGETMFSVMHSIEEELKPKEDLITNYYITYISEVMEPYNHSNRFDKFIIPLCCQFKSNTNISKKLFKLCIIHSEKIPNFLEIASCFCNNEVLELCKNQFIRFCELIIMHQRTKLMDGFSEDLISFILDQKNSLFLINGFECFFEKITSIIKDAYPDCARLRRKESDLIRTIVSEKSTILKNYSIIRGFANFFIIIPQDLDDLIDLIFPYFLSFTKELYDESIALTTLSLTKYQIRRLNRSMTSDGLVEILSRFSDSIIISFLSEIYNYPNSMAIFILESFMIRNPSVCIQFFFHNQNIINDNLNLFIICCLSFDAYDQFYSRIMRDILGNLQKTNLNEVDFVIMNIPDRVSFIVDCFPDKFVGLIDYILKLLKNGSTTAIVVQKIPLIIYTFLKANLAHVNCDLSQIIGILVMVYRNVHSCPVYSKKCWELVLNSKQNCLIVFDVICSKFHDNRLLGYICKLINDAFLDTIICHIHQNIFEIICWNRSNDKINELLSYLYVSSLFPLKRDSLLIESCILLFFGIFSHLEYLNIHDNDFEIIPQSVSSINIIIETILDHLGSFNEAYIELCNYIWKCPNASVLQYVSVVTASVIMRLFSFNESIQQIHSLFCNDKMTLFKAGIFISYIMNRFGSIISQKQLPNGLLNYFLDICLNLIKTGIPEIKKSIVFFIKMVSMSQFNKTIIQESFHRLILLIIYGDDFYNLIGTIIIPVMKQITITDNQAEFYYKVFPNVPNESQISLRPEIIPSLMELSIYGGIETATRLALLIERLPKQDPPNHICSFIKFLMTSRDVDIVVASILLKAFTNVFGYITESNIEPIFIIKKTWNLIFQEIKSLYKTV